MPVSAREWIASARRLAEPVMRNPTNLATAMPRFARKAATIALRLPSCTGVGWHTGIADGRRRRRRGAARRAGGAWSPAAAAASAAASRELLAAEGAAVAVNYRARRRRGRRDRGRHHDAGWCGQGLLGRPSTTPPRTRRWSTPSWPTSASSTSSSTTPASLHAAIASPTPIRRRWAGRRHPRHRAASPLPGSCCRRCAPGPGDIVMISSVATSHYAGNGAPYNMGKAALEALAFTLAKEERAARHPRQRRRARPGRDRDGRAAGPGHGRRPTSASWTPCRPFGHVCQPIDVARVVVWLCSDGRRLRHRPAHRVRRRRPAHELLTATQRDLTRSDGVCARWSRARWSDQRASGSSDASQRSRTSPSPEALHALGLCEGRPVPTGPPGALPQGPARRRRPSRARRRTR